MVTGTVHAEDTVGHTKTRAPLYIQKVPSTRPKWDREGICEKQRCGGTAGHEYTGGTITDESVEFDAFTLKVHEPVPFRFASDVSDTHEQNEKKLFWTCWCPVPGDGTRPRETRARLSTEPSVISEHEEPQPFS